MLPQGLMGSLFFLGVFCVLAMAVRPAKGWHVLPNVIIILLCILSGGLCC